jgi:hypothetical protein
MQGRMLRILTETAANTPVAARGGYIDLSGRVAAIRLVERVETRTGSDASASTRLWTNIIADGQAHSLSVALTRHRPSLGEQFVVTEYTGHSVAAKDIKVVRSTLSRAAASRP